MRSSSPLNSVVYQQNCGSHYTSFGFSTSPLTPTNYGPTSTWGMRFSSATPSGRSWTGGMKRFRTSATCQPWRCFPNWPSASAARRLQRADVEIRLEDDDLHQNYGHQYVPGSCRWVPGGLFL